MYDLRGNEGVHVGPRKYGKVYHFRQDTDRPLYFLAVS